MKNSNYWKALVVLAVAWALFELYPPTGRDLVKVFQEQAINTDTNFAAIVSKASAMEKDFPERAYKNLFDSIGTNDITQYFSLLQD